MPRCAISSWRPTRAGEPAVEHRGEPCERLVYVERDPEAARGLQRREAVQGGADDAGGVDRLVALEVEAAQRRADGVDCLGRGGGGLSVGGVGDALERRIGAGMLARVGAVG